MRRTRQNSTELQLIPEPLAVERALCEGGLSSICGVDEAGRGPLAGPVVAAAVVYRECGLILRARDSKAMTAKAREEFCACLDGELEFSVGQASPEEIDQINILRASLLAMERAVATLSTIPDMILVDGPYRLSLEIPSRGITHGDARVSVIGAASIIAKVTRDRLMKEYDEQYPGYGFARHFGYPTEEHRLSLERIGPCPIHRRSFHGVREFFKGHS